METARPVTSKPTANIYLFMAISLAVQTMERCDSSGRNSGGGKRQPEQNRKYEPPAKEWRAVIEKSRELYLYQALHQWCFIA